MPTLLELKNMYPHGDSGMLYRDTHLVRQFVGRIGLIGLRRDLVTMQIGKKSLAHHARKFKGIYDSLIAMGDDVITPQAAADFFLTSLGPEFAPELNRWGREDLIPTDLDEAIREATTYLESELNTKRMMEPNPKLRTFKEDIRTFKEDISDSDSDCVLDRQEVVEEDLPSPDPSINVVKQRKPKPAWSIN
jgi:hypothetical protein